MDSDRFPKPLLPSEVVDIVIPCPETVLGAGNTVTACNWDANTIIESTTVTANAVRIRVKNVQARSSTMLRAAISASDGQVYGYELLIYGYGG